MARAVAALPPTWASAQQIAALARPFESTMTAAVPHAR
jgi:hypothetical protein